MVPNMKLLGLLIGLTLLLQAVMGLNSPQSQLAESKSSEGQQGSNYNRGNGYSSGGHNNGMSNGNGHEGGSYSNSGKTSGNHHK